MFAVAVSAPVPAVESEEIDFPSLVKLAEKYTLPRAPMIGGLVLANTGATTPLENVSMSREPGLYRPAFLIEKLPDGRARVLMGWRQRVVYTDSEHRPAIRPYTLTPAEKQPGGYVLSCNNLSSFVTAVQLAQRGEFRMARDLWEKVNYAKIFHDQNAMEGIARRRADPCELLARCLYLHLNRVSLRENVDERAIHDKLVQLNLQFPVLFSDDERSYYPHRRTRFVRDLGLTLSAKKAPVGSVEALLVEWGNRTSSTRHLRYFNGHNVESERPARAIFGMGLKAIPELGKLVDDQRLTRHAIAGFMNEPQERVRLGELAKQLLQEMTGAQPVAMADTIGIRKGAECKFFENAAVDLKYGKISGFHDVPLWILGQKYPQALLKICSQIPSKALLDTPLFVLAEIVAHSKLAREEKTLALAAMCDRLQSVFRKRAVLQQLAKVDEERCVALLQPVLPKLPKDVNEPYWTCEAADYTHVVMQLQHDGIWRDYLKVAKRVAVGLRMEMMEPMTYSYIGEKNRKRRIAFLAAFLDDPTVRDSSVDAAKYTGPCAAATFDRITVRDFAAMKIRSILDYEEQPTESWTADEWTRLRRKVQAGLKTEKLPTLKD